MLPAGSVLDVPISKRLWSHQFPQMKLQQFSKPGFASRPVLDTLQEHYVKLGVALQHDWTLGSQRDVPANHQTVAECGVAALC